MMESVYLIFFAISMAFIAIPGCAYNYLVSSTSLLLLLSLVYYFAWFHLSYLSTIIWLKLLCFVFGDNRKIYDFDGVIYGCDIFNKCCNLKKGAYLTLKDKEPTGLEKLLFFNIESDLKGYFGFTEPDRNLMCKADLLRTSLERGNYMLSLETVESIERWASRHGCSSTLFQEEISQIKEFTKLISEDNLNFTVNDTSVKLSYNNGIIEFGFESCSIKEGCFKKFINIYGVYTLFLLLKRINKTIVISDHVKPFFGVSCVRGVNVEDLLDGVKSAVPFYLNHDSFLHGEVWRFFGLLWTLNIEVFVIFISWMTGSLRMASLSTIIFLLLFSAQIRFNSVIQAYIRHSLHLGLSMLGLSWLYAKMAAIISMFRFCNNIATEPSRVTEGLQMFTSGIVPKGFRRMERGMWSKPEPIIKPGDFSFDMGNRSVIIKVQRIVNGLAKVKVTESCFSSIRSQELMMEVDKLGNAINCIRLISEGRYGGVITGQNKIMGSSYIHVASPLEIFIKSSKGVIFREIVIVSESDLCLGSYEYSCGGAEADQMKLLGWKKIAPIVAFTHMFWGSESIQDLSKFYTNLVVGGVVNKKWFPECGNKKLKMYLSDCSRLSLLINNKPIYKLTTTPESTAYKEIIKMIEKDQLNFKIKAEHKSSPILLNYELIVNESDNKAPAGLKPAVSSVIKKIKKEVEEFNEENIVGGKIRGVEKAGFEGWLVRNSKELVGNAKARKEQKSKYYQEWKLVATERELYEENNKIKIRSSPNKNIIMGEFTRICDQNSTIKDIRFYLSEFQKGVVIFKKAPAAVSTQEPTSSQPGITVLFNPEGSKSIDISAVMPKIIKTQQRSKSRGKRGKKSMNEGRSRGKSKGKNGAKSRGRNQVAHKTVKAIKLNWRSRNLPVGQFLEKLRKMYYKVKKFKIFTRKSLELTNFKSVLVKITCRNILAEIMSKEGVDQLKRHDPGKKVEHSLQLSNEEQELINETIKLVRKTNDIFL